MNSQQLILDGAFVTDDVIVTVLNVNDGPFVVNPLIDFSMVEDTVDTSINLTSVFDDLDLIYGDVLTFSATGNNNIGVQINQNNRNSNHNTSYELGWSGNS